MSFLQFLSRGRRNRGLEMDATLAKKQPYLAKKISFCNLISRMRVTLLPLAYFMLSLFNVNALLSSMYAHPYSNMGSKWIHSRLKKKPS